MSNIDTAKAGIDAWSRGDTATLASLLTDDFTLSGPTPQPLDKSAFLGLCKALTTALPDWSFNATDFREEGDTVYATLRVTGTHTGTLAAIPGVPPVAPTGKAVALAADQAVYTMRGGQVARMAITVGAGGGVEGLYAAVGAPLGS